MRYRVMRLWTYEAQQFFKTYKAGMYTLLPTMKGATYELLAQALDEMKEFYQEQSKRFSTHLLWFRTFLNRTDTVTLADKEKVERKMSDFESLLREDPYVIKVHEEGREEGLIEGRAKGLQTAIIMITETRFPTLVSLAQQRVVRATKHDNLAMILKGVTAAPDEASARLILDLLAA